MSAVDIYGKADSLARALESAGFCEAAESIREPIEAGFTATEILMGLRHALLSVVSQGVPKRESLEAEDLVQEISHML